MVITIQNLQILLPSFTLCCVLLVPSETSSCNFNSLIFTEAVAADLTATSHSFLRLQHQPVILSTTSIQPNKANVELLTAE